MEREEIRCAGCGKLLAKRLDNGILEIRHARQVIYTERALLVCPKCGRENLARDCLTRTKKEGRRKGK